ncbi:MAG: hypothetical protein MI922_20455, partial [Bacteroidales bacterium]|nr:hypothetical protein [Bacteroidales bacterium]
MFKINFNTVSSIGRFDEEDSTVPEAIESAYDDCKPDIFIYWNQYKLYLSKKCDVSNIYKEIIRMIDFFNSKQKNWSINFLSSSFTLKMDFQRTSDLVTISPKWIDLMLDYEEKRIDRSELKYLNKDLILK